MKLNASGDVRAFEANVWKSYLYQFLLSFQLWWPIWVLYLTDQRGLSKFQVFSLEGLSWLAMVVAEVPTGLVADRWGRRASLATGGAIVAASIFVFGVSSNFALLFVAYLAWSIGITFRSGADSALLFDSLRLLGREDEFQRMAGRSLAASAGGVLLGTILGAPFAAWTDSYVLAIVVSAGIAFLSFFVALSMREPHVVEEGERQHESYADLMRESARTAYRVRAVRYAILLSAPIVMAGLWATGLVTQPFLENHNVALGNMGWFQAVGSAFGVAGGLVAYRVAKRLGMRTTVAAIPVALVLAYVVLGGWNSLAAFPMLPLAMFVGSLSQPLIMDYVHRRIPSSQRATILSVRQLVISIVIAAVSPGLGHLADSSLRSAFWCLAILVACSTPALLALWLRANREEPALGAEAEAEAAIS